MPELGQLVHLRQRRSLVEGVEARRGSTKRRWSAPPASTTTRRASRSLLWEHELDARAIADDGWGRVGEDTLRYLEI
jgi:hypothetical protein